jgi:hypothetical protein
MCNNSFYFFHLNIIICFFNKKKKKTNLFEHFKYFKKLLCNYFLTYHIIDSLQKKYCFYKKLLKPVSYFLIKRAFITKVSFMEKNLLFKKKYVNKMRTSQDINKLKCAFLLVHHKLQRNFFIQLNFTF